MNNEEKMKIQELDRHYDIVFNAMVMSDDKPQFYGRRENRTCRICGRSAPSTTFKKAAHIFPASLGCKRALTYEECDSCNDRFGKYTEPSFVDFIGARRVVSKIPKRKGHPKHKNPATNESFQYSDTKDYQGWIAQNLEVASIDRINRQVVFQTITSPYIPIEAYRTLIKIGYHFLPVDELQKFEQTSAWLAKERATELPSANVIETTFREKRLEGVHVSLFRRKKIEDLPYMGMTITFYNYTYLVYFPFCKSDEHLIGMNITAYNIPHPIHFHTPIMTKTIDLSSSTPVRETQDFIMTYQPEQDEVVEGMTELLGKKQRA